MYTTHTHPAWLHTAMQALTPPCNPYTNTIHTRIHSAHTPHIAHTLYTQLYTHCTHYMHITPMYSHVNTKQALYRALLPCIQHHRLQPCSATINDRHATLKLARTVDRHTLNLLQSLTHDTKLKQRPYRHKCISPPHMQLLDMPCSSSNRHASKNNMNQASTDHYQAKTTITRPVTRLISQTLTHGPYIHLLNSHALQIIARTDQNPAYTCIYNTVRLKPHHYTKILTCKL